MKSPITTTLDQSLVDFLEREALRNNVNRNTILEKALRLYQNLQLELQVKEGLQDRQEEYRDFAHDSLVIQKYAFRHLR